MNDLTDFPRRIPIFPLPVVLLPGQVRNLYIFELRYKALLQNCLHNGSPFGVVLERPSTKENPHPTPHTTGVMAHIFQVNRQPDDTFIIHVFGGERFRVQQFYDEHPFMQAEIVSAPLTQTEGEKAHRMFDVVSQMLEDYLDALTSASGIDFQIPEAPETPEQLGYLTAMVLQINNEQKQVLLEKASLPDLFLAEIEFLQREMDLMEWISSTIETPVNNFVSGSGPEAAISLN